jgi:hypothetical protein
MRKYNKITYHIITVPDDSLVWPKHVVNKYNLTVEEQSHNHRPSADVADKDEVLKIFSTGGSLCSHLLTLVPRSRIFLP